MAKTSKLIERREPNRIERISGAEIVFVRKDRQGRQRTIRAARCGEKSWKQWGESDDILSDNDDDVQDWRKQMDKVTWYTTTKIERDAQGLICDGETGKSIAVSYDPKDTYLIAAAPELLAALKNLIEASKLPYMADVMQEARYAVEKAESTD